MLEPSTKDIIHQVREVDVDSLVKLRINSINRLLIGTLNVNPVSSKYDQLKCLHQKKVDILEANISTPDQCCFNVANQR